MSNKKWISLIIILVIFLAGCTSTQAQTVTTPDEISVRLPWVHKAEFSGYYLADQEGYYSAENLNVKVNPVDFEADSIDQVLSGEDQFGEIPGTTLLKARAEGKPVVAIAMLYRRNPDILISLAENEITTADDMIGKRVGVAPGEEFVYRYLLSLADVDPAQITQLERTDFTIRPLIEGEYDVMVGYATDQIVTAKLQNLDLNVISIDDYGPPVPGHVIFTTEEMVENNPELVQRFLRATLKGFAKMIESPEKGVQATLRVDETLNVDYQAGVIDQVRPYITPDEKAIGYMDLDVWQRGIEAMASQDLLPASLDPQAAYTTQFLE